MSWIPVISIGVMASACGQTSVSQPVAPPPLPVMPWNELPQWGMQAIIITWVFVLGSCFGSFLNVVIYRLPAGMSLGRPKSRCPQCETPLAARDNVPVFGWLMLRGQCRYCSLPIPARYPIVEAVCGGVFVLLMFTELLTGAANLPLRQPDHFHINPGFWLVWFATWELSSMYLYHCLLLILVLATVMIGFDGHPPQKRLARFGVLVGLLCGVLWPDMRPVPAWPWPDWVRQGVVWDTAVLAGLLDGALGLIAGWVTGRMVVWQMVPVPAPPPAVDIAAGADISGLPAMKLLAGSVIEAVAGSFLLIGVFLGWQACGMLAIVVFPLFALARCICRGVSQSKMWHSLAPLFFVMLTGFLIGWRWLDEAPWMPGVFGWKSMRFGWQLEWVGTWLTLGMFAAAVRAFCVRVDRAEQRESRTDTEGRS